MKGSKRILVVTPTLGTSPYLAETVASVQRYAGGARHVLISPARARAALQPFRGSVICQQERPGTGSLYDAVNQAVEAHGEGCSAITYINDDDRLEVGFSALEEAWNERRAAGLLFGHVDLIDAKGDRIGGIPVARYRWQLNELMAAGRMPLAQQGAVIDLALWRQLGGFNLKFRLCADMELLARACRLSVPRFVPAVVASFRLHGAQLSKNVQQMRSETADVARAQVGRKWRGTVAYALLVVQNMGTYAARIRRSGFARSWRIMANEK